MSAGQLVPAHDLRSAADAAPAELPSNVEAERLLLGCLLYDNSTYERLDEGFHAEHFYEPFHGRLFEAIGSLIRKGKLAEPVLLDTKFSRDPAYQELGGLRYLADLVNYAAPSNATDYADEILDLALRRRLIEISQEAAKAAHDPTISARDHIEKVEGELFSLGEERVQQGFVSFEDALAGAIGNVAAAYERDGSLSGISTGLIDLDRKIGGLHDTDLIILAARPSMGKTALACNIAFDVAKHYAYDPQPDGTRKTTRGGVVAFYSLEMSADQLALRLLAAASGISGDRLRKGEIDYNEFGRIRDAAALIQEAPLFIDATGGITLAKIWARARRLKRTVGLDLVIIDYLQLVGSTSRHGANRVEVVSEITRDMKAMAKDLGVPVIALSQLSREVEKREDKKPQLADLRESGSIEQDADMVMFVYRESYYLSREEPKAGTEAHIEWEAKMFEARGRAEVIIGKQRHGPIGTVRLSFNEDLTLFGNLARSGGEDNGQARLPHAD